MSAKYNVLLIGGRGNIGSGLRTYLPRLNEFYHITSVDLPGANDKATDNTQSATQATATANGPGYSTGDAITVVINGNSYTHTLTAPALTRTLAATALGAIGR